MPPGPRVLLVQAETGSRTAAMIRVNIDSLCHVQYVM